MSATKITTVAPASAPGHAGRPLRLRAVAMAQAFLRWSTRPQAWFVRTAVALTALSLVPSVLVDADSATTAALIGLHLLAAAVVIPPLPRALRSRPGQSWDWIPPSSWRAITIRCTWLVPS